MKKFLIMLMIMSLSVFALFGCTQDEEPVTEEPNGEEEVVVDEDEEVVEEDEEEMAEDDIVAIASADDNLSTLVAALQEADLVETLQGEGPFTVFAPTNEAFEKLLAELDITAEELLAHPDLGKVLTYHVVSGEVMSTDLEDGMEADTVNGQKIMVDLSDGVMINDAGVTTADIEASNGVIHVIDTVLVPDDFEL